MNCHERPKATVLGLCEVCDGQGDTSDAGREQIEGVREMAAYYGGVDISESSF